MILGFRKKNEKKKPGFVGFRLNRPILIGFDQFSVAVVLSMNQTGQATDSWFNWSVWFGFFDIDQHININKIS